MKKYIPASLILTVMFYACTQVNKEQQSKETSETSEKESVQESRNSKLLINKGIEITLGLQQALAGHLIKAIEDSGVSYALKYCNLQAYPLTDSISRQHNASVKRVSHKARNPNNKVSFSELEMIGNFQKQLAEGNSPEPVIEETPDRITYFAPIMLMSALCLRCHGIPEKDIAAEDYILINMIYPEDQATGFRLNDLRGMWRVDFDKSVLVQ